MTGETNENVTCGGWPQSRVPPEGLSPVDLARWYRRQRREFYERIAALVDMPTRPTVNEGIAWRSARPGRFHSLIVFPYIGDFDYPGCTRRSAYLLDGPPVPRIHLNHFDYQPSRTRKRLWSGSDKTYHLWSAFGHRLELTVAIGELVDFVPWVVARVRAMEAEDSGLILPPPPPLEFNRTPDDMLGMAYAWTMAASADYYQRMWFREWSRAKQAERRERMSRQAGQKSQTQEVSP